LAGRALTSRRLGIGIPGLARATAVYLLVLVPFTRRSIQTTAFGNLVVVPVTEPELAAIRGGLLDHAKSLRICHRG
jgi:hypothetical protein